MECPACPEEVRRNPETMEDELFGMETMRYKFEISVPFRVIIVQCPRCKNIEVEKD